MEHKVTCVLVMVLMLAVSTLAEDQAGKEASSYTCTMTLRERVNCGYSGITAEECTSRGCCFNDRTMGYPWCFHPLAIENPEEGSHDRVLCSPCGPKVGEEERDSAGLAALAPPGHRRVRGHVELGTRQAVVTKDLNKHSSAGALKGSKSPLDSRETG
uniref:Trefoil factor 1 n=1 Tax=Castor canadensis TaxID=51338 RepID=A0A8B7WC24_CASCN|nr:trefoil factor 1 [Castor canadensis]